MWNGDISSNILVLNIIFWHDVDNIMVLWHTRPITHATLSESCK